MPPKKISVLMPDGRVVFKDKEKKTGEKRGNPNLKKKEIKVEKPVEIPKPKAKGRGKAVKPVGNVAETLDGKASKARVTVTKSEIDNPMIVAYRKELEEKKAKIERNIKILDAHHIY